MVSNSLGANAARKFGKELRSEFLIDDNYLNLNHGEIVISLILPHRVLSRLFLFSMSLQRDMFAPALF